MNQAVEVLFIGAHFRTGDRYCRALEDAWPATCRHWNDAQTLTPEALKGRGPDVIIWDGTAVKNSPAAFLERRETDSQPGDAPVVVLTSADSEEQLQWLDTGADDFVSEEAPLEIFTARIKAQLRHKLAVDRLERMALDRDLFAAAVLQNIRDLKANIVTSSRAARKLVEEDPTGRREEIEGALQDMTAQASKLGNYACDVIQTVRASRRTIRRQTVAMESVMETVQDMSLPGEELTWSRAGALQPVMADPEMLRLALYSIGQHARNRQAKGLPVRIAVGQTRPPAENEATTGRGTIVTRFVDDAPPPETDKDDQLFSPQVETRSSSGNADGSSADAVQMPIDLGLSLVARVASSMGGQVWAETGEEGFAVCLELPEASYST